MNIEIVLPKIDEEKEGEPQQQQLQEQPLIPFEEIFEKEEEIPAVFPSEMLSIIPELSSNEIPIPSPSTQEFPLWIPASKFLESIEIPKCLDWKQASGETTYSRTRVSLKDQPLKHLQITRIHNATADDYQSYRTYLHTQAKVKILPLLFSQSTTLQGLQTPPRNLSNNNDNLYETIPAENDSECDQLYLLNEIITQPNFSQDGPRMFKSPRRMSRWLLKVLDDLEVLHAQKILPSLQVPLSCSNGIWVQGLFGQLKLNILARKSCVHNNSSEHEEASNEQLYFEEYSISIFALAIIQCLSKLLCRNITLDFQKRKTIWSIERIILSAIQALRGEGLNKVLIHPNRGNVKTTETDEKVLDYDEGFIKEFCDLCVDLTDQLHSTSECRRILVEFNERLRKEIKEETFECFHARTVADLEQRLLKQESVLAARRKRGKKARNSPAIDVVELQPPISGDATAVKPVNQQLTPSFIRTRKQKQNQEKLEKQEEEKKQKERLKEKEDQTVQSGPRRSTRNRPQQNTSILKKENETKIELELEEQNEIPATNKKKRNISSDRKPQEKMEEEEEEQEQIRGLQLKKKQQKSNLIDKREKEVEEMEEELNGFDSKLEMNNNKTKSKVEEEEEENMIDQSASDSDVESQCVEAIAINSKRRTRNNKTKRVNEIQSDDSTPLRNVKYLKFQASIHAEVREVFSFCKLVTDYGSSIVRLELTCTSLPFDWTVMHKKLMPLFALPKLREIILGLNYCFDTRRIFYTEDEEAVSVVLGTAQSLSKKSGGFGLIEELLAEQGNKGLKCLCSKDSQQNVIGFNINNKSQLIKKIAQTAAAIAREKRQKQIEGITASILSKASNPNLECIELNFEMNAAHDEDIEIVFRVLQSGYPALKDLELSWSDSHLSKKQVDLIANGFERLSEVCELSRIGLKLWRNFHVQNAQVEKIVKVLSKFTKLTSIQLGFIDCGVKKEMSQYLCDLLKNLPFLRQFEMGLDSIVLSDGMELLSDGLQSQKFLQYIGFSAQAARINEEDLVGFARDVFASMHDLRDLKIFLDKNELKDSQDVLAILFETLARNTQKLRVLSLSISQNRLTTKRAIDALTTFIHAQTFLQKAEFWLNSMKFNAGDAAKFFGSLRAKQPFKELNFQMEKCKIGKEGYLALTKLLNEIPAQEKLEILQIATDHNPLNLTLNEQAEFGKAISRFRNLRELELDFSGCSIQPTFFETFSRGVAKMKQLTSLILLFHRCSLFKLNLQFILKCLKNKPKLEDLTLEVQESFQPMIDQMQAREDFHFNILLPKLRVLRLNLLKSNLSFHEVNVLLFHISGRGFTGGAAAPAKRGCRRGGSLHQTKHGSQVLLEEFSSLNVEVCNQELSSEMMSTFAEATAPLRNASELVLNMEACDLSQDETNVLFKKLNFNKLRNLKLNVSSNRNLDISSFAGFLLKQKRLAYLDIHAKCLAEPVAYISALGFALDILDLKLFSLFFEQSTLTHPRELEQFYQGLATLVSLEILTLHLHNLDHSMMQFLPLAIGLRQMHNLKQVNLHLTNSIIRSLELKELAISMCDKVYLKELQFEFFKNEILDKSGVFFAKCLATLPRLQKLDFSLMRCEVLPCIAEKLALGIGELHQLKKLHLYLGENSISSFTMTSLTFSFMNLRYLTDLKLNLQDSIIGDEGVQQLAIGLHRIPDLISLDLNLENTDLRSESLSELGKYFTSCAKSLKQLEISMSNNPLIEEAGFQEFMTGLGCLQNLKQILLIFHNCQLDAEVSAHLPLFLRNKSELKYLHVYFDQNTANAEMAKLFGIRVRDECPNLKLLTLCIPQNQIGNEGITNLLEPIFSLQKLKKATIDIRFNDISDKNTIIRIANAIPNAKSLLELELLVYEDNDFFDNQIAKGLPALAQKKIDLCYQMSTFEVRNNKQWKDLFKNSIIPIQAVTVQQQQFIAFDRFIAPHLIFHSKFSVWDLFLDD